ncbi:MAG: DUF6483 family protein [Suipraeoptans sp.]
MVQKDYVMRLIQELVQSLLRIVFKTDTSNTDYMEELSQDNREKLKRWYKLIDDGDIDHAENELIEDRADDMENFKLSLLFYGYLNEKSNEYLEGHDFSRVEIADGIRDIADKHGYGSMAEASLEMLPHD